MSLLTRGAVSAVYADLFVRSALADDYQYTFWDTLTMTRVKGLATLYLESTEKAASDFDRRMCFTCKSLRSSLFAKTNDVCTVKSRSSGFGASIQA